MDFFLGVQLHFTINQNNKSKLKKEYKKTLGRLYISSRYIYMYHCSSLLCSAIYFSDRLYNALISGVCRTNAGFHQHRRQNTGSDIRLIYTDFISRLSIGYRFDKFIHIRCTRGI